MERRSSVEVRAHPLAEVRRLPDVEHPSGGVDELVHAGAAGSCSVSRSFTASVSRPSIRCSPSRSSRLHDAVRRCSFEQDVEQDRWSPMHPRAVRRVVIEAEVGGERGGRWRSRARREGCVGRCRTCRRRGGGGIEALTVERDIEEAEIEADVVTDDDRTGGELDQRRDDGLRSGSAHERVGDAGEVGDPGGDRSAGMDEGPERPEAGTTLDDGRADLGDRVVDARSAGGLDVEHAEPHVDQRRVQGGERHRAPVWTNRRSMADELVAVAGRRRVRRYHDRVSAAEDVGAMHSGGGPAASDPSPEHGDAPAGRRRSPWSRHHPPSPLRCGFADEVPAPLSRSRSRSPGRPAAPAARGAAVVVEAVPEVPEAAREARWPSSAGRSRTTTSSASRPQALPRSSSPVRSAGVG